MKPDLIPTPWNPEATTFPDHFRKVAKQYAEKVAVRSVDGEMTYNELDQLSDDLARELIGSGIEPEELVCGD